MRSDVSSPFDKRRMYKPLSVMSIILFSGMPFTLQIYDILSVYAARVGQDAKSAFGTIPNALFAWQSPLLYVDIFSQCFQVERPSYAVHAVYHKGYAYEQYHDGSSEDGAYEVEQREYHA